MYAPGLVVLLFLIYSIQSEPKVTKCDDKYGWCEQSMCQRGCHCQHKTQTCKQVCLTKFCSTLKCRSNRSCRQSIIDTSENAGTPKVESMIASSVEVHQDCSRAACKELYARRFPNARSKAMQFCHAGNCSKMVSQTDITEQIASHSNVMRCSGAHTSNCTQVCIDGTCKTMICKAKHCIQRCEHDSTCHMTCGRNTETCQQKCSHGSKCAMKCYSRNCQQFCKDGNCFLKKMKTKKQETATVFHINVVNDSYTVGVEVVKPGDKNDRKQVEKTPIKNSKTIVDTSREITKRVVKTNYVSDVNISSGGNKIIFWNILNHILVLTTLQLVRLLTT